MTDGKGEGTMFKRIGNVLLMLALVVAQSAVLAPYEASRAIAAENVLILNPSFEEDLDDWETNGSEAISISDDGWVPDGGGHKKLSYYSDTAYVADTYQTITDLKNGKYMLSAWTAVNGAFDEKYMYVKTAGEQTHKAAIPSSSQWTQVHLQVEIQDGGMTIGFYADAHAGAWLGVDLVTLTYLGDGGKDMVIIPNNSFEDGLSMWQTNGSDAIKQGSGWAPAGGGSHNLNYWSSSPYIADTWQTVTGIVYGDYEISVWTASDGTFHELYMYVRGGEGTEARVDLPRVNTWTKVTLPVTVSHGELTIGFYADAEGGAWANIDLVEISKVTEDDGEPEGVPIVNYDFEELAGDGTLVGWEVQGDKDASDAGSVGYKSGHALMHLADQSYEVRTYQRLENLENGTYTLSAWAWHGGRGDGIAYLFAAGSSRSEARTALPETEGWTKVYVRGIEAADGTLTIGLHTKGEAGTWAMIDRVELVKDDQPYRLLKGGDVSELTHIESRGGIFYDREGNPKDLFQILKENGHDIVRIRLYNNPGKGRGNGEYYRQEGIMDKEDILKLARRAKDAGLQIQFTFHYSDYWTNGETQIIPYDWQEEIEGMTDEEQIAKKLEELLYEYTKDIMTALKEQGTLPEYVSLGNEMQGGLLYPYGRAAGDNWRYLANFLKAGYKAVKEVSPESRVVLHLDDAGNYGKYITFFDKMAEYGVEYDVIGPSYYPFWTKKTIEEAVDFFVYISEKYDKDILVMETGYKWNPTLPNGTPGQLTNNGPYPEETSSPEGQKNFMIALFNGLKSAGNGRIIGDLYWDPIMIEVPGVGWAIREADDQPDVNVVSNTTLFDFDGKALPVHDAYLYNTEGSETGNIIGRVLGTGGTGIARAELRLTLASGEMRYAKADPWGNYLFPDVPPGTDYRIEASKPGYESGTAYVDRVLAGQNTVGVIVTLTGGRISGTVLDDAGDPAPRAKVTVSAGEDVFTAETDQHGRYVLQDVPEGTGYIVMAAKAGYVPGFLSEVSVRAGETTEADAIRIVLNSGSISGKVVDAAGLPVEGAVVSVDTKEQRYAAVTDAAGRYEILHVPAGEGYTVQAVKEKYDAALVEGVSVEIGQVTDGVDFVLLSSLGAISGVVTNPAKEPVAGAAVIVERGDEEYRTLTDEAGRYVVDGVPAGSGYVVRAAAEGYLDGYSPGVTVKARQTTKDVEVRLLTPILLNNPSFELRVEHDRTIIPEWHVSTTEQATYIQYHEQAVDGSYVLSAWLEQPFQSDVWQTIAGLADGFYRITFWSYNGGDMNAHYMYVRSRGGDEVRVDIPASSGMRANERVVEIESGQLTIGFYTDGNSGNWMLIDNVQVGYLGTELPGIDGGGGDDRGSEDGGDDEDSDGDDDDGDGSAGSGNDIGNGSGKGGGSAGGVWMITPVDQSVTKIDLAAWLAGGMDSTLDLEVPVKGDRAAAVLSSEQLVQARDEGVESLVLRTDLAIIQLSAAWLAEAAGSAAGKGQVEVSVAKLDPAELPADIRRKLVGRTLYDIAIKVNGTRIEELKGSELIVEIPYALGEEEMPHQVVVHFISEDGEILPVANGLFDLGAEAVLFRPKHLGKFAVWHENVHLTDISDVKWAKQSIELLAARGIVMIGDDHRFEPAVPITRGAFTHMLVNALELAAADQPASFSDVEANSPWHDAIAAAEQLGIARGIGNGRFGAADAISRQDLAVLIDRALQTLGIQLPRVNEGWGFQDQHQIADYALEAVDVLHRAGLMRGTGQGQFSPLRPVTRAEAAVVTARLIERLYE